MHVRFRDEGGAVAVVVALVMVILIGLTAFAVDAGYLYSIRRQLQSAADAAALAGCRILIDGGDEAAAMAEAQEYATLNAVAPGDALVMVTTSPQTEVTDTYVQVTVEKDTELFFARIFSKDATTVRASARAQVAYLTGMQGIVPWALPILHANRVTARLGSGPEFDLYDAGSGLWSGAVDVPAGAQTNGLPLTVTAYNAQTAYPDGTSDYPEGVPETLFGAGSEWVRATDAPIVDVWLDDCMVTAGTDSSVTLYVTAPIATKPPGARFAGKNHVLTPVADTPGLWSISLAVPVSDDLKASYPIDVSVDGFSVTDAAYLVVRRSTYPIIDVSLSPTVQTAGSVGAATVSVQLNDYVYGREYELKVVGGAGEVGNFCALDLTTVKHTPYWMHPQHPSEFDPTTDPDYDPPCYYNYLAKELPFSIHIGDTIWTQPGVLSGPTTERSLDERFAGDMMTFALWSSTTPRPPTRRIVYVPVVEKLQETTGQTPMRVVSFAAFFVDPESNIKKDSIIGTFIEYVTPSDDISDTPPDGLYMMTVHLVTPVL
ncbi:MAG: pilus assembly protein TadG-related protein [Coriobacteriia bacterium]